jgi:hypothetical protein
LFNVPLTLVAKTESSTNEIHRHLKRRRFFGGVDPDHKSPQFGAAPFAMDQKFEEEVFNAVVFHGKCSFQFLEFKAAA